jgi:hypothetical protein
VPGKPLILGSLDIGTKRHQQVVAIQKPFRETGPRKTIAHETFSLVRPASFASSSHPWREIQSELGLPKRTLHLPTP